LEAALQINPALLGSVSALLGILVGVDATLVAAIFTQSGQDRPQRVACEVAKRETAYAYFVMCASNLLLGAYTNNEIKLGEDEQRLIGFINRMRLFGPRNVVSGAEAVLRSIVEIALNPSIEICRADLDSVRRSVWM
jgi:hypothetical protein